MSLIDHSGFYGLMILLVWMLGCVVPVCGAKAPSPLCPGRFGRALDTRIGTLQIDDHPAYGRLPITVECWARVFSNKDFNIFVAHEPKASSTHWEIYSYARSGAFSAYLPGFTPSEVVSRFRFIDPDWHYLAMTFDGQRVQLFADEVLVADQAVTPQGGLEHQAGPLLVGTVSNIGCDGEIDEVRISNTVREMTFMPTGPFRPDDHTVGLWRMDDVHAGKVRDASPVGRDAWLLTGAMDEIDAVLFGAGPSPLDSPADPVKLSPGDIPHPTGPVTLNLAGTWEMAEDGDEAQRVSGPWSDAIPAAVPGSVHSALVAAGRIPDPKVGRNDVIAHAQSFRTWWLRRTFSGPAGAEDAKLIFDGVAIHCTVWLNGQRLGEHEGMFGGPEFDVTSKLHQEDTMMPMP